MSTSERISALLREHGVIDGHNDLLWAAREKVSYDFDQLELRDSDVCQGFGTHTDLPRLRAGGVGAQFWSVFVPATLTGDAAVTATPLISSHVPVALAHCIVENPYSHGSSDKPNNAYHG